MSTTVADVDQLARARAAVTLARVAPFALGALRVAPAERTVTAPHFTDRLEPRVMQVLVALARAEGAIVSRNDLVEACWGGRIVGDDAINRAVARVRRVLREAGDPDFDIETISKVGYRLRTPHSRAPQEHRPGRRAARPSALTRRHVLIGGGSLLATAGAGYFWLSEGGRGATSTTDADVVRGLEASRLGSAESTAQAVSILRDAVGREPENAVAWGALALAYYAEEHFIGDEYVEATRQRSLSAAQRALVLDPRSATAHAAQALWIPSHGRWIEAEAALRKALALDQTLFETRMGLARLLSNVGRTRAAVAMLEPLSRAPPPNPIVSYFLAFLLWQAGRVVESDQLLDRAQSQWPRNYTIWFTRFWQRAYSGRPSEALAMLANTASRPTGIPDWNFDLIETSARALQSRASPDVDAAIAVNRAAASRGAGFAENAIELAAALGDADEAFTIAEAYYLGRGFTVAGTRYSSQQGSFTRPDGRQTKLLFSPSTATMRSDSRFLSLTDEIGLGRYWQSVGSSFDLA